jgi:hypothetical protein
MYKVLYKLMNVRVVGVPWNLRDVTVLWRFNARSDGNLDVVVTNGTFKL